MLADYGVALEFFIAVGNCPIRVLTTGIRRIKGPGTIKLPQTSTETLEALPDLAAGADLLARVNELYDSGLMLQAYSAAQAIRPMRIWRGVEQRVLAGRLAMNLGARRL